MTPRSIGRTLEVYRHGLDVYLAQWGTRRYRVPALLSEVIRALPRGSRVLDLGCGPAQDTRYLASRGFHAVGLDAVGAFLVWARHNNRTTRLVCGDMRRPPFRPRSFDAVWAAASLIHLPKRTLPHALRQLRVIVKPSGCLAATFVHGTTSGLQARGWLPGRYVSRWTKPALTTVIERNGWEIEALTTVTNRERKGRWLNLFARARAPYRD
jgi:SAM-dependent methyltransferase